MSDLKMNTLVPMQSNDGAKCLANSWDVANMKAGGWQVIGELSYHTSSTKAPFDLLDNKAPKTAKPPTATP